MRKFFGVLQVVFGVAGLLGSLEQLNFSTPGNAAISFYTLAFGALLLIGGVLLVRSQRAVRKVRTKPHSYICPHCRVPLVLWERNCPLCGKAMGPREEMAEPGEGEVREQELR